MAAPLKPWERPGVNNAQPPTVPISGLDDGLTPSPMPPIGGVSASNRPPVPPRSATSMGYGSQYSPYGSSVSSTYGSMFNPMMSGLGSPGSYGMMGPYNRFGGMGGMAGGIGGMAGGMGNMNNTFVNQAESSARGAFQSVESVVSAVSAVSMMLESTYYALHNSFRAVLGVADQFSKLKLQLSHLATSFAVFKFLRWLYRRLLVLLGLRKAGVSDGVWNDAVKKSAEEAQKAFPVQNKASWPIVLFFAIAFGGPYLIWRMLRNMTDTTSGWINGRHDHVVGEALYDFISNREDELCFKTGDRLNLAPAELQPRLRENDWLLASLDGEKTGMVPASYVKILGRKKGSIEPNQLSAGQILDNANNVNLENLKNADHINPAPPS